MVYSMDTENGDTVYVAKCKHCGQEFQSYSIAMALKKLGNHSDETSRIRS